MNSEKKQKTSAEKLLAHLADLSEAYAKPQSEPGNEQDFAYPLDIIQTTMNFTASVLYKVTNEINGRLMLEVVRVMDPAGFRKDLAGKEQLRISMDSPDPVYANEVEAYRTRQVSFANIPGTGCDIAGYIYVPEEFGSSYLLGGDFYGTESSILEQDISAFDIMCNFLSLFLIKNGYAHEAVYDHLTGLLNSRSIKQEVERLSSRASRKPDTRACIAMADIDHFKKINDTYGHLQGDLVLKQVAAILNSSMRQYFDVAGRYGGEEFLLVLDDTDEQTARKIVERIRRQIEDTQFSRIDSEGRQQTGKTLEHPLTLSFGIACIKALASSAPIEAETWIERADKALYAAKNQGRNRTVEFSKLK